MKPKKQPWRKVVWRGVRLVVIVYVCLMVYAQLMCNSVMFQPHKASYGDSDELVKIVRSDGEVIPAMYLVNSEAQYTVLYHHANAVDLGDIRGFLQRYQQKGFSVLCYEYPGYGIRKGRPSEKAVCRDAEEVLKWLVEQKGVPMDRILIHGRSVGGGPALYVASRHKVAGLIVESSFVSAFRVVTHWPLVPFDRFVNISRIGDVSCPVLVIHGRKDRTIPFWHGERLYERAKEPKYCCWLDGASHNEMPSEAIKQYWNAISSFSRNVTQK